MKTKLNIMLTTVFAEEVEGFVVAEMMKVPGIAYAMTRSDLFAGRI